MKCNLIRFFFSFTIIVLFLFILMSPMAQSQEAYRFQRMWPVIPQPWYFKGPVSIEIDKKDNFYVVDEQNNLVYKYTPDGMFVTKWGTGYLKFPYGIALDENEYVYVFGSNGIDKFTSDGRFVANLGISKGSGDGQFDKRGELAIDQEGCIYAVDYRNDRVQKFGTDGAFQLKWGSTGEADGQFDCPKGITIDENGDIYVVDSGNRRIQKFTSTGEFVSKWSEWDNPNSGRKERFITPEGIVADGKGHVFVAESDPVHEFDTYGNILKFSLNGEFVCESDWQNNSGMYHLSGIAVNSAGNIYVTNISPTGESVLKCDPDGNPVAGFQDSGREDGMFVYPRGICLDSDGNVYIPDVGNVRVQKFDPHGNFMEKWSFGEPDMEAYEMVTSILFGANDSEDDDKPVSQRIADLVIEIFARYHEDIKVLNLTGISSDINTFFRNKNFHTIWDIAMDSAGNMYVCDSAYGCIHKITTAGEIEECVISNPDPDQLFWPISIILDEQDNFYISDYATYKIYKYDSDAKLVTDWGGQGDGDGEFEYASAMALDSEGNIHIVDARNICVQKFDSNGVFLSKWELESSGMRKPMGIAFDENDNVFLVDQRFDKARKFGPDKNLLVKWGGLGTDPDRMNAPESIAVGKDGSVYVVDTGNNRVQKFKNVTAETNNKAIIVAGGGLMPNDTLWDTTQMCAHYAYRALTYQGFAKEDIHYLTPNSDIDLDGNGELDDVDNDATPENLEKAITEWAAGDTDNVVLYMVDHGLKDEFFLTNPDKVTANQLKNWLDTLQNSVRGKIVVVYDACFSGSFLPVLTGSNRIVITSTSPDEVAHFTTHGAISFSNYFWGHIFNGRDFGYAFRQAEESLNVKVNELDIGYQSPLLDGDGNGVGNESADYAAAGEILFLSGTGYSGDIPVISRVPDSMSVSDANIPVIKAKASDDDGISKVWAEIAPAGYKQWLSGKPVAGIPSIELTKIGEEDSNVYEGEYGGFTGDQIYYVSIFAMDTLQNISKPKMVEVSVSGALRRKAIIFLGETADDRTAMENNAKLAYKALSFQGYSEDDIYLLSPSTIPDIPRDIVAPKPENLKYAIEDWASDNALDLVLYMTGEGGNEKLTPGGDSEISATELDAWLDNLQGRIPGTVLILCDADYSGSFLPALTPPEGKQRIVISSTNKTRTAYFDAEGDISFSGYFWRRVLNGANVGASFEYSGNALSSMFGAETAQLDDTGDGVGNMKNSDSKIAAGYTIGAGIMLAGLEPSFGEVSFSMNASGTNNSLTVRTGDISASESMEKVWAMIIPASGDSEVEPEYPVFDLEPVDGGYGGAYQYAAMPGDRIAVFAKDTDGNVSLPKIVSAASENAGGDSFEPDDGMETATHVYINDSFSQRHNFHQYGDKDWMTFHALASDTHTIRAFNLEAESDPVLAIYDAKGEFVGDWDKKGYGEDEEWDWRCFEEGIYFLQITHYDPSIYGENTGYDFEITKSTGAAFSSIEGTVSNIGTGLPVSKAIIKILINGNELGSDFTDSRGFYRINLPPGNYSISVEKPGYDGKIVSGITIPENDTVTLDFSITSCEADADGDGISDCEDNCMDVANPNQEDSDGDGTGNACDQCPDDPDKTESGKCGCGEKDTENCQKPDSTNGGGGGCFISIVSNKL